ncbi:MAG TPA: hypothetical protein VHO69_03485 [Phototrophicaceae bacterium]|nr:hypothetical protein [Phototrophicaceae bacterium]
MTDKRFIPNSFQMPNVFIDDLMFLLTDTEWRVLCYMTRHILGWQDKIAERQRHMSLMMFVNGFGEYPGCGLSKPAVKAALDSLAEFGLIERIGKPTTSGQLWRLAFDGPSINWEGLQQRQEEKSANGQKRTAKARSTKGGKSDLPVSGTNRQRLVGLTGGGQSDKPNQTQAQTQKKDSLTAAESEENTPLYPCTSKDVTAMIVTWYEWTPRRPTKRGREMTLQENLKIPANREYAENLYKRGVRPSDFAECLGLRRLHPPPEGWKEWPFCYAGKVVEGWAEADRAENWYTDKLFRVTTRKPGQTINRDELMETASAFNRLYPDGHPVMVVDVPPPLITLSAPHEDEADLGDEYFSDDDLDPDKLADEGWPL